MTRPVVSATPAAVRALLDEDMVAIDDDLKFDLEELQALKSGSYAELWNARRIAWNAADRVEHGDAWNAAVHTAWLIKQATTAPPEHDLYDTPWRPRRGVHRVRAERVTPERLRDTLATQIGSLRRHGSGSKALTVCADRAEQAIASIEMVTARLVGCRHRLGRCLSLGWPLARTRAAVDQLEVEAHRAAIFHAMPSGGVAS